MAGRGEADLERIPPPDLDQNFKGVDSRELFSDDRLLPAAMGFLKTSRISASERGSLVCSLDQADPAWPEDDPDPEDLEEAGTKTELTKTSIRAGTTGWRGVEAAATCLKIQSLIGTLYLEKALDLRSWWMQWTGRNPLKLAFNSLVTGTLIA